MNQITLELAPGKGNARNSEGSFVALKSGRILFIWSRYRTNDSGDEAPCDLASTYSDDGGITWSTDHKIVVASGAGGHNVMSVSLLRLQNGRIALLYAQKEKSPAGIYRCTPLMRFSDDEGESFSEPVKLTLSVDYHVVNNDRLIQLKNGDLVVPAAHHRFIPVPSNRPDAPHEDNFNLAAIVFFYISTDSGLTWKESRNSFYRSFPDGTGFQEPGVIELKDGRLWAWARTQWKNGEACARQWQSFSEDGGQLWSEPVPSAFISPCSPLSMKRMPDGNLLAVWNDRSGRFPFPERGDYQDRQPLSCALSSDEGVTWKNHFLLESDEDRGYCYTAIHFTADAVLLAYCAGGPDPENCLQRLRIRRVSYTELQND